MFDICQIFCVAFIVQHHGKCSFVKSSYVKFLSPENAIRGLFSHHKIKTTLEDGVRPGTGMKKRIDQKERQERQKRINLCVKIKAVEALNFSAYPPA